MPVVGGEFFKDADSELIEELKRRGVLHKAGRMTHPYPHCWRCGTPLLYYARTSWFIRTTAYKDTMLARNARIDWHPIEVGEGRFGEWLKNNVDWAVSRDRFWGTPLPVWVCDADDTHLDVIGSFADLASRGGSALGKDFDPHKPNVDKQVWKCRVAGCAGTMHRVPEVIDAWFDSGRCPSRNGTFHSRTAISSPTSIRGLHRRGASTRRAAGSTRCWPSRPGWAMRWS